MLTNPQLCALFSAAGNGEMMDFPRLINLCYHLMRCEGIEGDVVEFGCHRGKTAAMLASITRKRVWLFDSFKGLPAKSSHDITRADLGEGALKCERFDCEVRVSHLDPMPTIVEGWWRDIGLHDVPHRIAFAHIDGDFHSSTKDALRLVYPHLNPGAVCFVDDAPWAGLPGVKVALDEFLANKPEKLQHFAGPCGALTQHVCFTKI